MKNEKKEEGEIIKKPQEVWYGKNTIELDVDERIYEQMKEYMELREIEDVPNGLAKHLVGTVELTIWTNENTEEGIWEGPSAIVKRKKEV